MLRAPRVLAVALLAVALSACEEDEGPQNQHFVATLSGTNTVPNPVNTPATGTGSFTVSPNGVVGFGIDVQNITGVTASHIHLGASGQNGPVLVDLFIPSAATGAVSGNLITGSFQQANIKGASGQPPITLDSLVSLMRSGGVYVNVHTTTHRAGLIRGQIQPGRR